jgi:putative ATPase
MLLQGPPGSGKSTLARLIASKTKAHFEPLSAVTSGVADIKRVAEEARQRRELYGRGTVLFMDEIHRLNKAQQDYLLPYVEEGVFILVGATTENPYYSINGPLRSRCRLFVLEGLGQEELMTVLRRSLVDATKGLAMLLAVVDEDALSMIAEQAGGDGRVALNVLETSVLLAAPEAEGGKRHVTVETVQMAMERPMVAYDRAAEEHYDTISAYIKSIRGSDPDAAVYWLAKMLEGGEDPRFVARRMVIAAAEDIGLADPQALVVAVAAAQAVELVGMPECNLPLAEGTIYLALAPKSNSSCGAISAASAEIKEHGAEPVPGHLAGGIRVGDKRGEYKYPHDSAGGWVAQEYLPAKLRGRRYWVAKDNMVEREMQANLARRREEEGKGGAKGDASGG